MLQSLLLDIAAQSGRSICLLTREMQSEAELFASVATLSAVETYLRVMAAVLEGAPVATRVRLRHVDWPGWTRLHDILQRGTEPRRDAIWYAVNGLVPQTLELVDELRRRDPAWLRAGR